MRSPHAAPPRPVLTRRAAAVAVAAAAAASLALAGTAAAQAPGGPPSFEAAFTTAKPATSSGYTLRVAAPAPAAGTVLPNFLRQTVRFPAGTKFATSGARVCTSSDGEVAAEGARAVCPAGSRVGTGVAEGVLGGKPVHFDLVAYNFPGRIHFAAEKDGKPLKQGFYGTVAGRTLTLDVPTAGGAIAPTLFSADIRPGVRNGRAYMTTPRRCAPSGQWRVVTTFVGRTALSGGADVGTPVRTTTDVPCRARRSS